MITMRQICRSREGAWIEICRCFKIFSLASSRSREGAWIEIPSYGRLKRQLKVAPVRERGLKLEYAYDNYEADMSLP